LRSDKHNTEVTMRDAGGTAFSIYIKGAQSSKGLIKDRGQKRVWIEIYRERTCQTSKDVARTNLRGPVQSPHRGT